MKKTVFLLLCAISLKAQTIKSSGTYFIGGVKDKDWSNINGDDFTSAKFKSYSGTSYVIIEVTKDATVNFKANSRLKAGELEFKLIDEQDNEYFSCKTTKACELTKEVRLVKNQKYKLLMKGEDARGTYQANWKIIN